MRRIIIALVLLAACDPCAAVAKQAGNVPGETCTLSCADLRCADGSSADAGPSCPDGGEPICYR